ncbi:uncharacterized protein F5891DRAFT_985548 [Suillus fuscotomentosus]|uniref:Uncharacterized protein n=1 Tax=Suillus fuscotomentosus TaxID=1912939 RepID=A0AAD4DU00_9AGAM|nr:uncharacterized protein F5891DRAFT_985548 [Suillus fuscotomentosus]KAG1893821.1 hypothetical protein F5891DRAFT_985548 [Suillus fuscotomentosus]
MDTHDKGANYVDFYPASDSNSSRQVMTGLSRFETTLAKAACKRWKDIRTTQALLDSTPTCPSAAAVSRSDILGSKYSAQTAPKVLPVLFASKYAHNYPSLFAGRLSDAQVDYLSPRKFWTTHQFVLGLPQLLLVKWLGTYPTLRRNGATSAGTALQRFASSANVWGMEHPKNISMPTRYFYSARGFSTKSVRTDSLCAQYHR